MTQGQGGWVLELRCVTCDATDVFRGVLLTFAGDLAVKAGWTVSTKTRVLIRDPGEREELCPKCSDVLAG